MTLVILSTMKTALAISEAEFLAAEKLAKQLGVSRNEFYRMAISEFVMRLSKDPITEKLNAIYNAEGGRYVDGDLQAMQAGLMADEQW